MTLEAHSAEPAPTRRSSRLASVAPAQPVAEALTRAELRRRAALSAPVAAVSREDEHPAVSGAEPVELEAAHVDAAVAADDAFEAVETALIEPVDVPEAESFPAQVAAAAQSDVDDEKPATLELVQVDPAPSATAETTSAETPGPTRRSRRATPAEAAPRPAADPDFTLPAFAGPVNRVEVDADDSIDEFDRAARAFSFTGETPVQIAAAAIDDDADAPEEPVVGRRGWRIVGRRAAAASFSVGVMGIVGLLAVGMTTPASAVSAHSSNSSASAATNIAATGSGDDDEIQAYVASSDVQNEAVARSGSYATVTKADLAAETGVRNFDDTFTNDPNAAIQWPFPVGVPFSWGYGMRSGKMHEGIDFTPGEGAEIHAIADGTVRLSTEGDSTGYGVYVLIDHVIDGQLVTSRYGHMLYGSREVQTGDKVTVGQVLGKVGNTGHSFGAHLHFEILLNGTTAIDPLEWMYAHTS